MAVTETKDELVLIAAPLPEIDADLVAVPVFEAEPPEALPELDAGTGCCGAAGLNMLLDRDRAAEHRAPLVRQFEDSGATLLLSANIGCRLHLAGATDAPVQHPLEFLASRLAASTPA